MVLIKIKSLLAQPHDMIRYLHQLHHSLSSHQIKKIFDSAFMHGLSEAFFVVALVSFILMISTIVVQRRSQ